MTAARLTVAFSTTAGVTRRRFVLAAALLLAAPGVRAGSLQTDAAPCARQIRIDADAVPLGQVLERLSSAMGFQLTAKMPLEQPVTLHRTGEPADLLRQLTRGTSVVLKTDKAARCQGRETVAALWVLPKGGAETPRTAAAGAPEAPTAAAGNGAYPAEPAHKLGTRRSMSKEQWQEMRRVGRDVMEHSGDAPPTQPPPQAEK